MIGDPAHGADASNGNRKGGSSAADYERALAKAEQQTYVLRLFVRGMTPRSQRAIDNIRRLCEEQLPGHYELAIIDIYQQPLAGKAEQVFAAPTLIKTLPMPLRRILGDLSNAGRVRVALGLKAAKPGEEAMGEA